MDRIKWFDNSTQEWKYGKIHSWVDEFLYGIKYLVKFDGDEFCTEIPDYECMEIEKDGEQ